MKYLIRSVKYFVALCVLCVALMGLMLLTGTSQLTAEETLYLMFHSDRFLLLAVAVVVLAATYPRFGFVVRRTKGSIVKHRQQIESAFHAAGFVCVADKEGILTYRAENPLRRLMLLFEDEITVREAGDEVVVEGIRRVVAPTLYRLESYIEMVNRNEQ